MFWASPITVVAFPVWMLAQEGKLPSWKMLIAQVLMAKLRRQIPIKFINRPVLACKERKQREKMGHYRLRKLKQALKVINLRHLELHDLRYNIQLKYIHLNLELLELNQNNLCYLFSLIASHLIFQKIICATALSMGFQTLFPDQGSQEYFSARTSWWVKFQW